MNKLKQKGFSLIELSIVILIVSIFAASVINLLGKRNSTEDNKATKDKLEVIMEALKVYYKVNLRLPCPALFTVKSFEAGFGVGTLPAGSCSTAPGRHTASGARAGMVPVVDLGLPASYAFDVWNNRITYVVDASLTQTSGWDPGGLSNIYVEGPTGTMMNLRTPTSAEVGTNPIDCRDGTSLGLINNYSEKIPDCPAVILVSHGVNGYLAYLPSGAQNTSTFGINSDQLENQNTGTTVPAFDNKFLEKPLAQDVKSSDMTNYFDDILLYKTMSFFKN